MLSNFQYKILKTVDKHPFISIQDLQKKISCKDPIRFENAIRELVYQKILIMTPEQNLAAYQNSIELTSKFPLKYHDVYHLFLPELGHAMHDEHIGIQRQVFISLIIAVFSLFCSVLSLIF